MAGLGKSVKRYLAIDRKYDDGVIKFVGRGDLTT